MPADIGALLVAEPELSSPGDWLDGEFRLPEFKFNFTDSDHRRHPLHIVGRYLNCAVHGNALTNSLDLSGESKATCRGLAKRWRGSFARGLAGALISERGSQKGQNTLSSIRVAMAATIIARAKEICPQIDPPGLALLLSTYPEQTIDWLKDIPQTAVAPLISAVLFAGAQMPVLPFLLRKSSLQEELLDAISSGLLAADSEWIARSLDEHLRENATQPWAASGQRIMEDSLDKYLKQHWQFSYANRAGELIMRFSPEVARSSEFELELEGHKIKAGQDGRLACRIHSNQWCDLLLRHLEQEVGAPDASSQWVRLAQNKLSQIVDDQVVFNSGATKEKFTQALYQQPASWGKLAHLRDFVNQPFPILEIPNYLAADLAPADIQDWLRRDLLASWQMELAEQLRDLRSDLGRAGAAQLASEWSQKVFLQLREQPETMRTITFWQDRGHDFAGIIWQASIVGELGAPTLPGPAQAVVDARYLFQKSSDLKSAWWIDNLASAIENNQLDRSLLSEMGVGESLSLSPAFGL